MFAKFCRLAALYLLGLGAGSPVFGAGCDATAIPISGTDNIWFCENNSDTVIVFVHGLNSDSLLAWKRLSDETGDKSIYWPDLVVSDPNLKHPSVYLAGFYTKVGATDYGMADAANELYAALSTPSGNQVPVLSKRNILFVGHSLGGIIVREVLVDHAKEFADKRVGLLLVASPSYGSDYATMLATVASVARQTLVEELKIGSPFLRQLDQKFKLLRDEQTIPSLVGVELVENQFVDLGAGNSGMSATLMSQFGWTLAKVFGTRVVEPASAARYFAGSVVIPKSDHYTIARPTGLNDLTHRELVRLFIRMQERPAPECQAPPSFRVMINLRPSANAESIPMGLSEELMSSLPKLKFWRTNADDTLMPGVTDSAFRDSATGRHIFAPTPPFPCPGDAFRARFQTVPLTSYRSTDIPTFTTVCFKHSNIRRSERFAFIHCAEHSGCVPDRDTPGLAETCSTMGWRWPALVSPAHAQEAVSKKGHWIAPSLATLMDLPAGQRPGYAEFSVRSGPISGAEGATHFSFALTVNAVPIYFDGVPPHGELEPFNGTDGVRLTFGVENLGFTGGEDGHERLELELRYWKGKELLKSARLNRTYVSYRHAALEKVPDPNSGDLYEWKGYYRPAKIQNRYEIMLAVGADVLQQRTELDRRHKIFDQKPVVGVIRPGRIDNPVYGMTLGLKLPSGQVSSSFTETEAKDICRWVTRQSDLPAWMRRNSYVYEFPSETITEANDRGRQRPHCQRL
jgi:pimeloyl-ACP methyl ester carboxylesterase